jgi:hypothetical protein
VIELPEQGEKSALQNVHSFHSPRAHSLSAAFNYVEGRFTSSCGFNVMPFCSADLYNHAFLWRVLFMQPAPAAHTHTDTKGRHFVRSLALEKNVVDEPTKVQVTWLRVSSFVNVLLGSGKTKLKGGKKCHNKCCAYESKLLETSTIVGFY